ncbi:hypothetical protein AGR4A_Lc130241 [Agrobacterium tumefaciens str. B6]|uniref:Uncharacterized protein n=1 Tax=Agrobacterium tumefaciens str. B6 TaxID=1183423 RepID=A0A822V597_AGRTU|nr:hypothetical protein AGR4A_Lc130241 [Agrobacterium tumefaciens str. B6]
MPVMLPFDVISTAPETSLIAKTPCPPEDVMEDAFPSVMAIPPIVSTLRASPEVDKPNPGCVTTVTGAEEKITADGSLPVAAPEQLQVSGPAGSQLPASDGEDEMSSDINVAAETADNILNDSTKRVSQGAMPPTIPLYFPTRPPRTSVLLALGFV